MIKEVKKIIIFFWKILFIQYRAIADILSILWLPLTKNQDPEYLEMEIRHIAHRLEKSLQHTEESMRTYKASDKLFFRLKSLIEKWKEKEECLPENIVWAKQILKEFTTYRSTGEGCILLGKYSENIRGLREIRKSNNTNSQVAEIDLLEFIKGRRSVRDWRDDDVSIEQIQLLIEAAAWSPSSCNRQTNRFIIIRNKNTIKILTQTIKGGRSFFDKAPVLIIVVNDIRRYSLPDEKYVIFQDAAAAIQNLLLMAHRIGLACCWASYTSDTSIIQGEQKVRRLLNIPRYYKISGIVAIGRPNMTVCLVPRNDVEKITYLEKVNQLRIIKK